MFGRRPPGPKSWRAQAHGGRARIVIALRHAHGAERLTSSHNLWRCCDSAFLCRTRRPDSPLQPARSSGRPGGGQSETPRSPWRVRNNQHPPLPAEAARGPAMRGSREPTSAPELLDTSARSDRARSKPTTAVCPRIPARTLKRTMQFNWGCPRTTLPGMLPIRQVDLTTGRLFRPD